MDWEQFAVRTPFAEVPADAKAVFVNDTVSVTYSFKDSNQKIDVRETFSQGGQLARVVWKFGDQRIDNFPLFMQTGGKWLCAGWNSQVYENNEISSGIAVRIEMIKIQENWLPIQFNIVAQNKDRPQQSVSTSLYIKNFLFNENLEILPDNSAR